MLKNTVDGCQGNINCNESYHHSRHQAISSISSTESGSRVCPLILRAALVLALSPKSESHFAVVFTAALMSFWACRVIRHSFKSNFMFSLAHDSKLGYTLLFLSKLQGCGKSLLSIKHISHRLRCSLICAVFICIS